MKCLILAGGKGERLWPLSRNNFPKQFIQIQKGHSIFQETVARNIPFCDEFIIVTNYNYRSIIANQMESFQGVPYRCVFEQTPRRTTAALTLACLDLQLSEYVFAVASDNLVDMCDCPGLSYKNSIQKAKECARDGSIVLFGMETDEYSSRFGYLTDDCFIEKPGREKLKILEEERAYQNLGMVLFQNGVFLNELKTIQPEIYNQCLEVHKGKKTVTDGCLYSTEILENITAISIEHSLLEITKKRTFVPVGFRWNDIGSLEDLSKTALSNEGLTIINNCSDSTVVNRASNQAVVLNSLNHVIVVNTSDAVYIGQRGQSSLLKEILHQDKKLIPFVEKSTVCYRQWGFYDLLVDEPHFRVRRVVLHPGKTIYEHRHDQRSENWTFVDGKALVTIDGVVRTCTTNDQVQICVGNSHQISNIGEINVVFIETAIGTILHSIDTLSDGVSDVTETELSLQIDPMVRLSPAFKDSLWGGTKLRDRYGKQCDYDYIAESWEMSAHPSGNSIVASGKHKGLSFSRYLETVGKEVLGWKCEPLQSFPLLIKFIDAKQALSLQVHPDDDYALEAEDEFGKNEMWYVVDAEPEAGLYLGFNRDVDRGEVKKRIEDNTIFEILNFFPTHAGDIFYIPSGTVHAIGAGNLICEIQQNSDCTYRLYDYNRRDKFGNPRQLHLQKALSVLNYHKFILDDMVVEQSDGRKLVRCKYFEAEVLNVNGTEKISMGTDSFFSVVCIDGVGSISLKSVSLEIQAGQTVFIPAADEILTAKGNMTIIVTKI